MKLAVLIACLAIPAAARDAVGSRVAQSAAAAERLQGPLDGAWTLRDGRGRTLYVFQIGDPPSGGPLTCAWRRPDGAVGVARCQRTERRLTIDLQGDSGRRAVLHPSRGSAWIGEFIAGGAARAVSLRRG